MRSEGVEPAKSRPIEGVLDDQINTVRDLVDAVERLGAVISPVLGPDTNAQPVDPGPTLNHDMFSTVYRSINENNMAIRSIIVRLHSLSERVEV